MSKEVKEKAFENPMIFYGYGFLFLIFALYFYLDNYYKFSFVFLGVSFGIIAFYFLRIRNGYFVYITVILSALVSFGIYDILLEYKLNKISKINECGFIGKIHITHKRGEISTVQFIGKHNSAVLNYQELNQFVNIENDMPICLEYHHIKGWLRAGKVYRVYMNNDSP